MPSSHISGTDLVYETVKNVEGMRTSCMITSQVLWLLVQTDLQRIVTLFQLQRLHNPTHTGKVSASGSHVTLRSKSVKCQTSRQALKSLLTTRPSYTGVDKSEVWNIQRVTAFQFERNESK